MIDRSVTEPVSVVRDLNTLFDAELSMRCLTHVSEYLTPVTDSTCFYHRHAYHPYFPSARIDNFAVTSKRNHKTNELALGKKNMQKHTKYLKVNLNQQYPLHL